MKRWMMIGALCALLAPSTAWAGGFLSSRIGGDTAGPAQASPSALFWNPGSLGLLQDNHLFVDLNVTGRVTSYTRDTTLGGQGGQRFETSNQFALQAQPMIAGTRQIADTGLTVGLGVYAPFSDGASWDENGAQRWHSIYGGQRSVYVTPAISYTPMSGLHIGGAINMIQAAVHSYRAIDLGAQIAKGDASKAYTPEDPRNEGRLLGDFVGSGFSWSLGATWEANEEVTVGLSYTSEVGLDMAGDVSLFVPRNNFQESVGDVEESARYKATWPRAVRLGVHWTPSPAWSWRLNAAYVQWSLYDEVIFDVGKDTVGQLGDLDQRVETKWNDTIHVRLGGTHTLDDTTGVYFGAGFENGAIPDETLAADVFDAARADLAIGFTWKPEPNMLVTAGYNHLIYLPRTVESSERVPSPTGEYAQGTGVLNANVTWRFADLVPNIPDPPPPSP